jgi:hypothetical protein
MPLPFERVFKRPGIRRILLPFTIGLVVLLIVVAVLTA